jgi:hypothetical protein
MVLSACSFVGLMLLPIDFPYWAFALLIAATGVGSGMFSAPNTSAIMSSVPAAQRGAASGMRSTFQNSGNLLSIGVFFSLMIAGLARSLPQTLTSGLQAQGVPSAVAQQIGALPPVATLFAAFLGVNPIQHLLEQNGVLAALSPAHRALLTGREFFPHLIASPFHVGLTIAFTVAALLSLVAAFASALRGGRDVETTVSRERRAVPGT